MGKSRGYKQAFEIINTLSLEEKDAFIRELMSKMGGLDADNESRKSDRVHCGTIVAEVNPQKPDCPHCAAKSALGYIVKNGMNRGAQRYRCKSCGRKFVSTTNTAFARTRKDAETWRKFIEMTLSQKSIAECAQECGICYQTSFNWRHKVLNAFVVNQDSMQMSGRIEMDDMFMSVSYKGNRMKGHFGVRTCAHGENNGLPRKSYRRGSDNKSKIQAKACIMCMVQDENKAFFAAVPGLGPANEAMLQATVGKHVQKENSRILSDNAQNNIRFFEANNYKYRAFASNVSDNRNEHKPEIDGNEHIQHVNNFHSRLRKFLGRYCGVSTKYLAQYVALFAWMDNIKATRQKKSVKNVSIARTAAHDCYITSQDIYSRPMIPTCATA